MILVKILQMRLYCIPFTTCLSQWVTLWVIANGVVVIDLVRNTFEQYWPRKAFVLHLIPWTPKIFTQISKIHFQIIASQWHLSNQSIPSVAPELLAKSNNHSSDRWSLENGYDDSNGGRSRLKTYPYRVFTTGPKAGLYVGLAVNEKDLDYICRQSIQGFKVILHSPEEIPQPSKHFFHVTLSMEVSASVKPNMIKTSKELQSYAPTRKLCFFNSERKLRFFKVYTQRHCELECLSNYTLDHCGCVPFAYPRNWHTCLYCTVERTMLLAIFFWFFTLGDKDAHICGLSKLNCARKSVDEMAEENFLHGLDNIDEMPKQRCFCLPACTSITYETELSLSELNLEKYVAACGDEQLVCHSYR